ncbi:MAG: ABC transporter permease [Lachnospiraceae bacterium]|nr:ABC transporter permease [Lachnospiraceae bacterium]
MNPFSSVYYVKENIKRSLLLILMFILTFTVYIAGLYISNTESMFNIIVERDKKTAMVSSIATDKNCVDYAKAIERLEKEKGITLLHQGVFNDIYTTSIMGFDIGFATYSFRSKEDFQTYCDFTGINLTDSSQDRELGDGSVIMNRLQAASRGMKIGDKFVAEDDEFIGQEYTLDAVTDNDGYSTFFISGTDSARCLVLNNSMDESSFKELLKTLETEYNVYARGEDYNNNKIGEMLGNFYYIYFFVIILLSVIMAVTVNAAFTGMYQHRTGEFAIYKAMGIPARKIRLKILSEVLLIDVTGILAGLCIIMASIYLANNLYLIPHGLKLFYYNNMSLAGMVTSNLIILIPVTIFQGAKLVRADICG